MQCIVVKSDEFEKSLPLYIFPLNPDYVAARSLRSLRSNNVCIYAKDLKRQSLILLCSWRCVFPQYNALSLLTSKSRNAACAVPVSIR